MAWISKETAGVSNNHNDKEFFCETQDDIATLPGIDECALGSRAVVAEEGKGLKLWILKSDGWRPV